MLRVGDKFTYAYDDVTVNAIVYAIDDEEDGGQVYFFTVDSTDIFYPNKDVDRLGVVSGNVFE